MTRAHRFNNCVHLDLITRCQATSVGRFADAVDTAKTEPVAVPVLIGPSPMAMNMWAPPLHLSGSTAASAGDGLGGQVGNLQRLAQYVDG